MGVWARGSPISSVTYPVTEPVTHWLKTWPDVFDAVWDGRKTFEVRLNDRNYQVGDQVRLVKYDPESGRYLHDQQATHQTTADSITLVIPYILNAENFGLKPGYVAFSINELRRNNNGRYEP